MKIPIPKLSGFKKKSLTALILFPPGLGEFVEEEIQSILDHPWMPEKNSTSKPKMIRYPEKILIHKLSIQSLLSICIRSFTIRDIFVQLGDSWEDSPDSQFHFPPDMIPHLTKKTCSVEILTRKNPNFKKEAQDIFIQELFSQIPTAIQSYETQTKTKTETETEIETQTEFKTNPEFRFLLSGIGNRWELFLGIFPTPNYRREFRKPLAESYPLSEDISAILLQQLRAFCPKNCTTKNYTIPFAGTGTLGWEAYSMEENLFPGILKTPPKSLLSIWDVEKTWDFLIQKAKSLHTKKTISYFLSDFSSQAVENSLENLKNWENRIQSLEFPNSFHPQNSIGIEKKDFFRENLFPKDKENICFLLPLHPPYGIRSKRKESSHSFFQRLAIQIRKEIQSLPESSPVYGFVLVPDVSALQAIQKTWEDIFDMKILHFSQGNLSIRGVFFGTLLKKTLVP